MRNPSLLFSLLIIITTLQSQIIRSNSQQEYLNNNQFDCTKQFSNTNGFQCNGNRSSCTSYVTFRSQPSYNTAPNIAFHLNSSATDIGKLNNISEVDPIPAGRLVIVPITCSCTSTRSRNASSSNNSSSRYYQHNARYKLQNQGETYLTMANSTYQGLSTCQAMINQNTYKADELRLGDEFLVPIMCACPTTEQQQQYRAQYLLSYLATPGDSMSQIAEMFGADQQSILDANELTLESTIYPYTPVLVPLTSEPTHINIPSSPPAQAPNTPSPPATDGSSSNKGVIIGVTVGVGILAVTVVLFLLWFFAVRPSRKKLISTFKSEEKEKKGEKVSESPFYTSMNESNNTSQMSIKSSFVDLGGLKHAIGSLTAYKFKEIQHATENFSEENRIKGSVFRGEFKGDNAAIKILKGNVPDDEISILKHINHSNITRLSGYCIHEGNTYMVFEYAGNGSLDDWLFHQQKHQTSEENSLSTSILGWKQRVQIACNIADALNYLHSYIQPPYIHKNLKSSNILLDSNFRAKITNFGLARTFQDHSETGVLHFTKHVVGTHGYLAPEYIENGAVTTKLDVFAFGVIILELLSGKSAIIPSEANKAGADNLLFTVIRKVFEGEEVKVKLMEFIDSNLGRQYPLDLAYSMAQLGHKCVDPHMNSRPSMSEVSMTLSKLYSSSLDWDPSNEPANSFSSSYTR